MVSYRGTSFAAYAEPPWLLHSSGELDLCSAPALTEIPLEGPTERGGTIGLDLAELTYMDSSGLHVILNTIRLLGERGRVVLFEPLASGSTPPRDLWTRSTIQVSDHPSSPHFLASLKGGHVLALRTSWLH